MSNHKNGYHFHCVKGVKCHFFSQTTYTVHQITNRNTKHMQYFYNNRVARSYTKDIRAISCMLLKRHSRRFFSKYPIHAHINCSASVSCSRRAYNCQGSSQCSLWIHLPNSTTLPEAISPLDVNLKISWTLGSFFVRGTCPLYSLNSLKASHSVIIASRRLGHDRVRCL